MLINNAIPELARTATVYSVVGSGISMPMVRFDRKDSFYEADIRIAGIPQDSFKIEINNRDIHVYYHIPFSVNGKTLYYPVTVYDGPMPFDVDVKKVQANFQDESLQIILPFNDLEGGYSKKIKIAS